MPMPVKMPDCLKMLPGMDNLATIVKKQKIAHKGVASINDIRNIFLDSVIKLIICQMNEDLFDSKP